MATSAVLSVSIVADAKRAQSELGKVGGALGDVEREAKSASRAVDGIAEASDSTASAASQAAGGLGDLGGALSALPGPLGALGTGMEAAAPAIMGVTGAADLLNLATSKFPGYAAIAGAASKALAVTQRVLGAAVRFAFGPWGLLIAAAVAALTILWQKNEAFRAFIIGVWNRIKAALGATLGWFSGTLLPWFKNLPGRLIGFLASLPSRYIALWRNMLTGAYNLAVSLGGRVVGFIAGLPTKLLEIGGALKDAGGKLIGKFFEGLGKLGSIGANVAKDLMNGIIGPINSAIQAINDVIPNKIGIGPASINLPDNPFPKIPKLANGGITTGPTLAVVGDNPGGREAIIPLDKYRIGGGHEGPVELSERSLERLAELIVAGSARVANGVVNGQARRIVGRPAA